MHLVDSGTLSCCSACRANRGRCPCGEQDRGKYPGGRWGYSCRACTRLQVRRWATNNRAKTLLNNAKRRAAKLGLQFNLALEDIDIPEVCPVLGTVLAKEPSLKNRDLSPSLDRIDPNGGYVRGNVRVISFRANTLKSNATSKELEHVLQDLRALGL